MNRAKIVFIIFGLLCLFLKIYFISISNPHLLFCYDEQRNYTIAANHAQGKGYGIYDEKMANHYRLSAFHTSSTVFLDQFLISAHIPQRTAVIVFYILSTTLYLLAVFYFYRILQTLAVPPAITYTATAIFALYPSVTYAVGPIYHYDNIVMPLHVINFYYLLQWIKRRPVTLTNKVLLLLSITLCCFLRSQVLVLYFLTGCLLLFIYLKNLVTTKHADLHIPIFLTGLAISIVLVYIPTLIKNKSMFNAYIISTQSGYEFLQGHNGFQKGNFKTPYPNTPLNLYVRSREPLIDSMDEYTESKVRSQLAWEWIKAHPGKECFYILKKTARYFMPENANLSHIKSVFRYHPFNIFVHFVFIVSILLLLLKHRSVLYSQEVLLLGIPVIASILLSVIYFFDFRLRYHAEPFIIILAAYLATRYNSLKSE